MFIERGKEYSSFAGAHVRVITVVGKTKVICGDLHPPGGRVSIPYDQFQNEYTPTFTVQPELPFPQENEGRARKNKRAGRNAWDMVKA